MLLAVFLPLLLIYALSVLVTPLYHVRYFFIYAAPAPLLLAAGLGSLAQYRRWLGAAALTLLLLVSGWSLVEFWANPLYRADDHRAAVADLAAAWRPGDAILVNAGWVYPVLEIYWPKALRGPDDALPPPLDRRLRLSDYASKNTEYQNSSDQPMLLTAGSVGGAPSLGWGLAESDFYATTAGETAHALMAIAARAPRIWHYRLYDTVNDPGGLVRDVLAGMGERRLDRPYPGRDYLRVQLFETAVAQQPDLCPRAPSPHVRFGRSLNLLGHATPSTATAGRVLYTTLCWEALDGIGDFPAGLSTSLRLYRRDPTGDRLVAQADAAPLLTTAAWPAGQIYRQPLALPLPASLPPGPYDLALIVYNTQDGAPLSPAGNGAIHGQRWPLTQVDVRLPLEPPPAGAPLARFDYIDLLAATVGRREAAPGDTIDVSLIWRPRPNQYRDTYDAVFFLIGAQTSQTWDGAPGGPAYPSGDWAPNYPVQEWETLQLSLDLPPGEYTLSVRLERANDGLPIPAHPGPLPWQQVDVFEIGRVKVR